MRNVNSEKVVDSFVEGKLLEAIKPLNHLSDVCTDEAIKTKIASIIQDIIRLDI